ncbi:MAG TPA: manganese catalase family protein [Pseudonocardia sp.]|nr:manganese catalase family protein [Pseudonocardia sp.]
MFYHTQVLQFQAKPDGPDPAFARRLQELLGGKWGELTVALQYLQQGWNCRLPGKYKDMLLAIGTEELAHVEMIATMINRLLDGAPLSVQEAAAKENPVVGAIYGHENPQHLITNGSGAYYHDSNGVPWSGAFTTCSGNLMADFQLNATAEMQGRLQAARIYNMTDDPGVKEMLRFNLARDHMHQNQWLAAIEQLKEDGLENYPVPSAYPVEEQDQPNTHNFLNPSDGPEAGNGRWARGPMPDGTAEFVYEDDPRPQTDDNSSLQPGDPRLYGTPPMEAAPFGN